MKPVLVILAAGMGSRYGGLKQIDPIDDDGHVIMDYSIHDALEAGFEDVVFIIKNSIEKDFKAAIGSRIEKVANVRYVYQEVDTLPDGYSVPEGREKPWGTAHAILQLKGVVNAPFAIINADDYYGKEGFKKLYQFLSEKVDEHNYCMVGYVLSNTISENGHVARGVCEVCDGKLSNITERRCIKMIGDDICYSEDGENTWVKLDSKSTVSMNMWGFDNNIIERIEARFKEFLDENLSTNPLKCEFLLPEIVEQYLKDGIINVMVYTSYDKWYGVTYIEDKEQVKRSLKELRKNGLYKF